MDGDIRSVEIFISYSHKDEKLREKLGTSLAALERQGLMQQWHDRRIAAGLRFGGEIEGV